VSQQADEIWGSQLTFGDKICVSAVIEDDVESGRCIMGIVPAADDMVKSEVGGIGSGSEAMVVWFSAVIEDDVESGR